MPQSYTLSVPFTNKQAPRSPLALLPDPTSVPLPLPQFLTLAPSASLPLKPPHSPAPCLLLSQSASQPVPLPLFAWLHPFVCGLQLFFLSLRPSRVRPCAVCMCVWLCVGVLVWLCDCVYVCFYTRICHHASVIVCVCVLFVTGCMSVYVFFCVLGYVFVSYMSVLNTMSTCVFVSLSECLNVRLFSCVFISLCVRSHITVNPSICSHTLTHTHTQPQSASHTAITPLSLACKTILTACLLVCPLLEWCTSGPTIFFMCASRTQTTLFFLWN